MTQPDEDPVIELTTGVPADLVERVPFFSVDGKTFTIPKKFPANLSMVYLRALRNGGADKATQVVMDRVLGPDAIDALAKCESITPEQMKRVMGVVQKKVVDLMESVSGN